MDFTEIPVLSVDGKLVKDRLWSFGISLQQNRINSTEETDVASGKSLTVEDETNEFYADLKRYLEKHATEMPFEKERAENIWKRVLTFRDRLRQALIETGILEEFIKDWKVEMDRKMVLEVRAGDGKDACSRIPWELLEGTMLGEDITLSVRRSVALGGSVDAVQTRPSSSPKKALHVLLVVARDYTNLQEVDHQIISGPLFETLQATPCRENIKIRTLRPPSFEALERHLEGSGIVYDVVHLDMHGLVSMDSGGTPRAKILFQSDGFPGEMSAIDAETLATLLIKHHIKAVVLNACESAHSESNFAQDLIRHGIEVVVASVYKLHMQAAMEFMRQFYDDLFLFKGGLDWICTHSRETMRRNTARKARFHTVVDVEDWVSMVLYHREGIDLRKVISFDPDGDGKNILDQNLQGFWNINSSDATLPECSGRQSETLQLECIFVEADVQTIVLTGFHGVGKTKLLEFLGTWWCVTGLFDDFIKIDFAEVTELSDTIFQSVLNHIQAIESLPSNDQEGLHESLFRPKRIFLALDHCHNCDSETKVMVKMLVRIMAKIPGNLTILCAPDLAWLEDGSNSDEFFAYEFPLGGLWREPALDLAHNVASTIFPARLPADWSDTELLDNLLDLVDRNPLAIMLIVESVLSSDIVAEQQGRPRDAPTTLKSACQELLAGHFPIVRAFKTSYPSTHLKFQPALQEFLMSNTGSRGSTIAQEWFMVLTPFFGTIPKFDSKELDAFSFIAFNVLRSKVGRPDEGVELVMERWRNLSIGEAMTMKEPEPDEWYLQKCREGYKELVEFLKRESLVVDDGDVLRIHPLLTRIMRGVLFDPDFSDAAAYIQLFAAHFYKLFDDMLREASTASDQNESISFVSTNLRNLVASQLSALYISRIPIEDMPCVFFGSLSIDIVYTLSKRVVFFEHERDRINVRLLWDAIHENYERLKRQQRTQKVEDIMEKATKITTYVSQARVDDLCRHKQWKSVQPAIAKAEDVIRDIIDADELFVSRLNLDIRRAEAQFGLYDNEEGLRTSIQMHEKCEKEAGKFLEGMTVEELEKDRTRLPVFTQVANARAVNKGTLHRLYQMLLKHATSNTKGINQSALRSLSEKCTALRLQVSDDWNYNLRLAKVLGPLTYLETKRLADWLIAAHNASDDLSSEKVRLLAPTYRSNIEKDEGLRRNAFRALSARKWDELTDVLLNRIERARKEKPINWTVIAEIHQLLASITGNQGNELDALTHAEKVLTAIEEIKPENLEHYWVRWMYALSDAVQTAASAGSFGRAVELVEEAMDIYWIHCGKPGREGREYSMKLLKMAAMFACARARTKTTSPNTADIDWRSTKIMVEYLRMAHQEEFYLRMLILEGELEEHALPLPDENINLKISDLSPQFLDDFEATILRSVEVFKGHTLRHLLSTFQFARSSRDFSQLQNFLDLFDYPWKMNYGIDTWDLFDLVSKWYSGFDGEDVQIRQVLHVAEMVLCREGMELRYVEETIKKYGKSKNGVDSGGGSSDSGVLAAVRGLFGTLGIS